MRDLIRRVLQEEVKNGKVICDNCGWSWKLSEGGHDPYICHQCNHNNEPKNLKEERNPITVFDDDSNKKYEVIKKIWDKEGGPSSDLNRKLVKMGVVSNIFPYLVYYLGGPEKVRDEIKNMVEGKVFRCKVCNSYTFPFKVYLYDVESLRYGGIIDFIADVGTTGGGRTWNSENGAYENVNFEYIDSIEGSDFADTVKDELKNEIDEFLDNKVLSKYGFTASTIGIDFLPTQYLR
jgi:hypothetical protein